MARLSPRRAPPGPRLPVAEQADSVLSSSKRSAPGSTGPAGPRPREEVGLAQLDGRDVDRQELPGRSQPPPGRPPARTHRPRGTMTRTPRPGDEVTGPDKAVVRRTPPDQRLHAHRPNAQVDHRLVEDGSSCARIPRASSALSSRRATTAACMSARRPRSGPGPVPWRCTWPRRRCPAAPRPTVRSAAHGNADADADHHVVAADQEGGRQIVDQALGQGHRARQRLVVVDQDPELVAAQAGREVVLADAGAQALGDHHQQLVAGGVTHRVVDVLEVVQVEQRITGRDAYRWSAMRVVAVSMNCTRFGMSVSGSW